MSSREVRRGFSEDFFLQALASVDYAIRPMFGCRMLYRDDQMLCFIMNNLEKYPLDNGVAFAVKLEHQDSLCAQYPDLRYLRSFGEGGPSTWLLLPSEAERFESDLLELAELLRRRDPRIGRQSPSARKKTKARKATGRRPHSGPSRPSRPQQKTTKKKKARSRSVVRR